MRSARGTPAPTTSALSTWGDGGNDYCPVLRLGKNDVALVRRNRGLAKRILEEGGVQCTVRYWSGAWEAEQLLRRLGAAASASDAL